MTDVSMGSNDNNLLCTMLKMAMPVAVAVSAGDGALSVNDFIKDDPIHGALEVVHGGAFGAIFVFMRAAYKDMCSTPQGPQRHLIFEELPQVRSIGESVEEGEGRRPKWLHQTFEHPVYSSWDDVPTEPLLGRSQWGGLAVAGALAVVLLSGGTATALIPALGL